MASTSIGNTTQGLQATDILNTPCGAVWRRVDLHLHSPGVASFRCPNGANIQTEAGRRKVAEAYVRQLREARIEVGALTDYNGVRIEWFQLLHDLARAHGITLLPGVEVSFAYPKYGLHVLAIFEVGEDLGSINDFLRAQHKDHPTHLLESDGRHQDIASDESPTRILAKLREKFGCLLIPPHPDQQNGFLKSMKVEDAARFLHELRPDAVEHLTEKDLERLKTNNACPLPWIERLACVEFSDPKSIEEIGKKKQTDGSARATYLKLSTINLEALRLALHDPETRLCVGDVPPPIHARMRQMAVSGSGFLGNLTIAWNDELNVLIGGRGVGKSAVIETLRYALAMEPYTDHSSREDLVRHALGSGGKVDVILERPLGEGKSRQYQVTRVWGEDPRVIERDSGKPVAIPPSDLLGPGGGPTIFGQREIYAVSGSEEYRLALLDALIGAEARHRADAVREATERLRANARAIMDVYTRLTKRDDYRQRLHAIEHEIAVYERHGAAAKLQEAMRLRADGQHLRTGTDAVGRVHKDWIDMRQTLLAPLETAHRSLLLGQSQQKGVLQEAANLVEKLQRDLQVSFEQVGGLFARIEQDLKQLGSRWREALRPLEEDINRIKQEAQTEHLDPDRLLRLTEERTALGPLIQELDRSAAQLQDLEEQRRVLRAQVRERRLAEHQLRRERADEISEILHGRLRLKVEYKGQKEDYRKRLTALLRGSGVSQDVLNRLGEPEATDGIALAEAAQAGTEEVQRKFGLTPGTADRLVHWLTAEASRLFEVEMFIPPDALRVELKVDDQYRPLERLSVGQRATAVLLLLFALEGRVLILDQPEDDLDNRFVYEDIVQMLREQKGIKEPQRRRQLIAATHNANIPVIGDAELVLALEAHEGHASVIGRASIDDRTIRELVKKIMEGGDEAFRRRAEKYGGLRELV